MRTEAIPASGLVKFIYSLFRQEAPPSDIKHYATELKYWV